MHPSLKFQSSNTFVTYVLFSNRKKKLDGRRVESRRFLWESNRAGGERSCLWSTKERTKTSSFQIKLLGPKDTVSWLGRHVTYTNPGLLRRWGLAFTIHWIGSWQYLFFKPHIPVPLCLDSQHIWTCQITTTWLSGGFIILLLVAQCHQQWGRKNEPILRRIQTPMLPFGAPRNKFMLVA